MMKGLEKQEPEIIQTKLEKTTRFLTNSIQSRGGWLYTRRRTAAFSLSWGVNRGTDFDYSMEDLSQM